MIDLTLKAEFKELHSAFTVRLVDANKCDRVFDETASEALISSWNKGKIGCRSVFGNFDILIDRPLDLNDDVVICFPKQGRIERLFRASSRHNTILFTERCDERCVMCSQPPREIDSSWRFPLYEQALGLVSENAVIGISGGEPTLYKDDLLGMIERVSVERPDISYHILSNGQHFIQDDIARLRALHKKVKITWGIPLYASSPTLHERIVGKSGAFNQLIENLFVLASTNATIELRTVLTGLNAVELPRLARFIADHISFVSVWAIMATEPIGFAKSNRERVFFDHTVFPHPINNALDVSEIRKTNVVLYNFPRCTVEKRYRKYCTQSISDWKNKFISDCVECVEKELCSGFFEWYSDKWSWAGISPIREKSQISNPTPSSFV